MTGVQTCALPIFQTEGIPLLEYYGISGDGILTFQLEKTKEKGKIKISIDEAHLKVTFDGIQALPLTPFNTLKALLVMESNVSIKSLTMEGKGINARLKGAIVKDKLTGNIEVMVSPSFASHSFMQVLLKQYLTSPGQYTIPVSQSLGYQ